MEPNKNVPESKKMLDVDFMRKNSLFRLVIYYTPEHPKYNYFYSEKRNNSLQVIYSLFPNQQKEEKRHESFIRLRELAYRKSMEKGVSSVLLYDNQNQNTKKSHLTKFVNSVEYSSL